MKQSDTYGHLPFKGMVLYGFMVFTGHVPDLWYFMVFYGDC